MKMAHPILIILFSFLMGSCNSQEITNNPVTYGDGYKTIQLRTNKACYLPGESVTFSVNKALTSNTKIRYKHLGKVIEEVKYTDSDWQWNPPVTDYSGYMVDVYQLIAGKESIIASIGVDVSSDWARFPRYGFLSVFKEMPDVNIQSVISDLNRYHLNGLQYYDWHYKHHMPLAGAPAAPWATWKDIMNRETSLKTVRTYISSAKSHGMKSLFYNLAYGALDDASADGVKEEWYIFKDKNRVTKDVCSLPQPMFKSDIFLTNPANTDWQAYIGSKNADVYAAFDFDGYHIDQLGDRGNVYDYNGNQVLLNETFKPFITAMKTLTPGKHLVMNAVNQFGQENGIAGSPVDFLYSEVWSPNESFSQLADVIRNNDTYSKQTKKTVLAAYMNYNKANAVGEFNTPGVLLCDAVIFAFGGSHLELGEHMLCKEYFPNNNLSMKSDLKSALIRYYDFLIGYQNLLRDGGEFNTVDLSCTNGKMRTAMWPPQTGRVSVIGKSFDTKQVIHCINFANARNFDWRDTDGDQNLPNTIVDAALTVKTTKNVKSIWVASPDWNEGVSTPIEFYQDATGVSFKLPSLLYWSMIVLEY